MDKLFMDKILKGVQVVATLIGVFIPLLLLLGYVYHLGFIDYFGLDSSLVPRDFGGMITESWYLGVMSLASLVPYLWFVFLFTGMFFFVVLGFMYFSLYFKDKKGVRVLGKVTKQDQGRKILGLTQWLWNNLFDSTMKLTLIVCTVIMIPMTFLLILISPFQLGMKEAEALNKRYAAWGCENGQVDVGQLDEAKSVPCISLIDSSQPESKLLAQGIYVSSNGNRIAIFQDKTLQIYPLLAQYRISKIRQPDSVLE